MSSLSYRRGRGQGAWGRRCCHVPRPSPLAPRPLYGFTLVELTVVSALLLILGGGLLTTLLTGQTSYLSADAYIQVQEEARKAFDNMVRELREAGGPLVSVSPNPPAGPGTQLDFQVALGYDLDGGAGAVAGCPDAAVCWGATDPNGVPHFNWRIRYQQVTGPTPGTISL